MEWKEISTNKKIQGEIDILAKKISSDYKGISAINSICVLKGAVHFFSDLTRRIKIAQYFEFISAASYYDSESPIEIQLDMSGIGNIKNKHVLVIDDIYDTGSTLEKIKAELSNLNPASIKTCAFLLKKDDGRITTPDYYCMEVEKDLFYIGYGMDYKGVARDFPFIISKTKD